MITPPNGIPGADWLATSASVRTLILTQQQEIQALRLENDELRCQLTALTTELASLRERIESSSRNSSKPPSSEDLGYCCAALRATNHLRIAKAVAASAADKHAIQDLGQSCCRSGGWMRWWSITPMPAAAAASCCREWGSIQIPCAIR